MFLSAQPRGQQPPDVTSDVNSKVADRFAQLNQQQQHAHAQSVRGTNIQSMVSLDVDAGQW